MVFYIVFESIMLVILMYFLFWVMFYKVFMDFECMSAYECGFDPSCLSRLTFSYRFFMISILFIIFDVEISLMLPIPFLVMNIISILVFLMFIFILIVGLVYEYYFGSLDWLGNFVSKA